MIYSIAMSLGPKAALPPQGPAFFVQLDSFLLPEMLSDNVENETLMTGLCDNS